MADPYFANVVLLAINNNGADTSTTFTDQSSAARTLTAVGNFQWDTAQAPTGLTSSGLSDGTGDFLRAANGVDLDIGSGDATWEVWLRVPTLTQTSILFGKRATTGVFTPWQLYFTATDVGMLASTDGTSFGLNVTGAHGMSIDTWYHVAMTRETGVWRCYVGGVHKVNGTLAGAVMTNTTPMSVGAAADNAANSVNGWLAAARFTVGVARYTGAGSFTPPALPLPTSAIDPPVAAFSGTPLSGTAPLTVTFTDESTNTPTSWAWDFGDGDTSTLQNPSHDYAAGTYTVELTATNAAGSDAEVKTDYITVTAPVVPPADQPVQTGGGGVRGRQYVERLTKAEEWAERLRLGIVFEQIEEADAAAATAARAQVRIEATSEAGAERTAAQQTAEAAREAYTAVYREYMQADAILEQYRRDVAEHRNRIRRTAAAILLLH